MLSKILKFITKYYLYSLLLLGLLFIIRFLKPNKSNSINKNGDETIVKDSTITDQRDGQTYRIRRFNHLWWMIDNVNLELEDSLYYKDVYIGRGSYYYDNDPKNGIKYGQLYDLSSALDACPNGWRLPTIKEWEALNEKQANCIWDNNSATGNYRDKAPSFEPTGGGSGYIYKGILPRKINKEEDHISYSDVIKYAYYWSQPDKTKPYFFAIDMERCIAEKRLFQGASTQKSTAQRKFYSCRCVQEAN